MKENIFKDIKRQVHAKKHTVGALIITMLIVMVSISVFLVIIPEQAKAASYGDFGSYKELTIESDYIDAGLSNFPILVHDNTGDLSDILANGSDIAFFNSAKDTQFNHEIELYNSTSGELWAWVNVTTVSDSVDTVFYMYYNDSDGGYPIGYNPTDVWDSNFIAVWHMNDTLDSTSNDVDLTNSGCDAGYTGKMGDCYRWVRIASAEGDYMYHDTFLNTFPSALTTESWFKSTNDTSVGIIVSKRQDTADHRFNVESGNSTITCNLFITAGGINEVPRGNMVSASQWYFIAMTYADDSPVSVWLNTTENTTSGSVGTMGDDSGSGYDFSVGAKSDAIHSLRFPGYIDEVRVSDIIRSDAWINASFHSQNETTSFLTFGSEQGEDASSSYSIKGLTSGRITWSGTAGTTVWCNSSGDGYEWAEVNMSINASDNVTEFRVWMDDLNDTSAYINASNITMYVSSDNSSYGEVGSFSDGGGNCTTYINSTNWNAGTMGSDPFAGVGLTNDSFEIYLVFKLTIPADTPTDTFWSAASDSFKIYIARA